MKKKTSEKIQINITDDNEQQYWQEYEKTKSTAIRKALITKYANLVKYAANRIHVKFNTKKYIERDDLVSYGFFGLIDAIEKYKTNRNTKFKTYALTRIQGAIYDELRKIDPLTRAIRSDIKRIGQAREILEVKLSRDVTPQEVADMVGITLDRYNEIMKTVMDSSVTSLDDVLYIGDDSDGISVVNTLRSSEKTNPDYLAEREDVRKKIAEALKELPQIEQEVLILYYYEQLTLREIGEVLSVSESRVSQLHTKARQALRYSLSQIKKQLI